MINIKATCPECGDVNITPRDLYLYKYFGKTALRGIDTMYSFLCPNNDHKGWVTWPADPQVQVLLKGYGIKEYKLHRPNEVDDIDRYEIRRHLGLMTHNDELDFMIDMVRLSSEQQLQELESSIN